MANGPTLPPQAYTREILAVAFNWLQSQPDSIRKLAQTPDALVGLYLRAQRYGSTSPEADAPVTSQNFVNDLKNLAEGLKQFDEPMVEEIQTREMPPSRSITPAPMAQAAFRMSEDTSVAPSLHSQTHSQTQPHMQPKMPPRPQPSPVPKNSAPTPSTPFAAYPNTAFVSATASNTTPPQTSPQTSYRPASTVAPTTLPTTAPTFAPTATPNLTPASPADLALHLNANAQAMIREVKAGLNLSSDAEVLNMMVALAYKNVRNLLG